MMRKTFTKGKNVILISIKTTKQREEDVLNSLEELESLVNICGGNVVKKLVQNLEKSNFYCYLSSSKLEELKKYIDELGCDIIVADDELTSLQLKTLRRLLGIKVIGRTRMILEVFSHRSKTKETKLLTEMLKLKYYLPLESEEKKEQIRQRMIVLHEQINEIEKRYKLSKENRKKLRIPTISIVGYTNSGKSSLFNEISKKESYTDNKLFATIDPLSEIVKLPSGKEALLEDNVGFIRKLPYNLIKLVHSSLAEIEDSDVIIHVIDVSTEDYKEKKQVVDDTLDLMKIDRSKIIEVFNKCDLMKNESIEEEVILVSIEQGINIEKIEEAIEVKLKQSLEKIEIKLPYNKSSLISIIYGYAESLVEEHKDDGIILKGYIYKSKYDIIQKYINLGI